MIRQRAVVRSFNYIQSQINQGKMLRYAKNPPRKADREIFWLFRLSLVIESVFYFLEFLGKHAMKIALWIATAICLIAPPILLAIYPAQYTPAVETLLNVLLFGVGAWATYLTTLATTKAAANSRWIPQARGSCRGLLTVWGDVSTLRLQVSEICGLMGQDLPELKTTKMAGVRSTLSARCRDTSERLDSIAAHLDDAVANWEDFIGQNCEGDECERVHSELNRHRERLKEKLIELKQKSACDEIAASIPMQNSPAASGDNRPAVN